MSIVSVYETLGGRKYANNFQIINERILSAQFQWELLWTLVMIKHIAAIN